MHLIEPLPSQHQTGNDYHYKASKLSTSANGAARASGASETQSWLLAEIIRHVEAFRGLDGLRFVVGVRAAPLARVEPELPPQPGTEGVRHPNSSFRIRRIG